MTIQLHTAVRLLNVAVVCGLADAGVAQDATDQETSAHPLTFPKTIEDEQGTVVIHVPQIDPGRTSKLTRQYWLSR